MVFNVACLQFCNSSNMDDNLDIIETLIKNTYKPDLIALPENCFLMPLNGKQLDGLNFNMRTHPGILLCQKLAYKLGSDILIGSVAIRTEKGRKMRNRSVYIDGSGRITGYYDKINLFDVVLSKHEHYEESRRFEAGSRHKVLATRFGNLGLSICYDLRFPLLFRNLALKGAKFIAVPAAFTYTTGQKHWHTLLRARAIENGCFVIAPALHGTHDNTRRTYGHSLIINPNGEILVEASENKDEVITATIDLTETDAFRKRMGIMKGCIA